MSADKSKTNKRQQLQAPRGMHDILPDDYAFYKTIFDKAEEIASYYGFQQIQTPHLEATELFNASLGETTDIVEKQMYNVKIKGGDSLTLRPEGTAPTVRAYIEHGMQALPQPVMLQYQGSFFRHERPQKGRFREFRQFGLEVIGEKRAIAEATVIQVLTLILQELGIKSIIVHVNSIGDKDCQGDYRKELLKHYRKSSDKLCKDCQRRIKTNPLRLLDCKEEKCAEFKREAPQMINHFCSPCKQHFKEVLEALDMNNTPYLLNSNIVRGLDYYSRTVFEIFEDVEEKSTTPEEKESKDKKTRNPIALGGGGRYDSLVRLLGRKEAAAAGGGLGVDRIAQLMKDRKISPKKQKKPRVFLIQLGSTAKYKSLGVIERLRKANIPLQQSISKDSIKGQLILAAKLSIPYVLIIGQREALEDSIIIRNMETRAQETVPIEKVVEALRAKL